jgi:predicted signal transduction protein with EAL and GGDEF domain
MESLIHRADQAMYVAKQGGRSRIVSDGEAESTPEAEGTV